MKNYLNTKLAKIYLYSLVKYNFRHIDTLKFIIDGDKPKTSEQTFQYYLEDIIIDTLGDFLQQPPDQRVDFNVRLKTKVWYFSVDKFQQVVSWCRQWLENVESDIDRDWFEKLSGAIVKVKNEMGERDLKQKELEIDLRVLVKYWGKIVVTIFEQMIEIVNKEFNLFTMKWDSDTIKDIEKLGENRKLMDFLDTFKDNKFFISIYLD